MLIKPNEFDVNERSATLRAPSPWSSVVNREADLERRLESDLAEFDQWLMTDPQSGIEMMVQSLSRALGYLAPIVALVILFSAVSDSF